MAETICVDPQRVSEVWPKVAHWIKQSLVRGDLGLFSEVEADVLRGNALLWLAWDGEIRGAAVTQIGKTQCSKVCLVVACGGEDVADWIGGIEAIEGYARDQGCDVVRILGRKGWLRLLKDYSAPKVILERHL